MNDLKNENIFDNICPSSRVFLVKYLEERDDILKKFNDKNFYDSIKSSSELGDLLKRFQYLRDAVIKTLENNYCSPSFYNKIITILDKQDSKMFCG